MNLPDDPNLLPEQKSSVKKHILLRAGFIIITIVLVLTCAVYTGNGWWVLMGLFLGFGFAVIWFLFILIETFILYSKKKNNLANGNILLLGIFILIGAIIFFKLNQ